MSAPAFTSRNGRNQYTLDKIRGFVKSRGIGDEQPFFEDFVQEVAIAVWNGRNADHAISDCWRKYGTRTRHGVVKVTRDTISLDGPAGRAEDTNIIDTVASTDQAIEDMDWDSDGAKKLLDKLSPHERYIVLGLANGVPMSRIALDLTVSASRASQILDTARRRLAGELPPSVRSKLRERPQPHWGRDWDSPARRRKEIRILQMNADGHTKQEMAAELGCTDRSVTQYMQCAIRRMGARNKTQAVAEAMRRGLIK
ncbi:MAG: response regulator transcription factor [Trueperaceae bacterium]|nr:response regulator transcription factor [Trueperaceae bacterium]